jgi:hypothetical protein
VSSPTTAAVHALASAVRAAGGRLALRHAWPAGFNVDLPFHLVTEARRAWPTRVDVELLGLVLGRRQLIKREYVSRAEAERWESAWADEDIVARRVPIVGHDDRWTLFGARDPELLDEAEERESALQRHHTPPAEAATRWLGEALGYPTCCVQEYVRDGRRDDLYALARCIPPAPPAAARAVSLALNPLLGLISYIPCHPGCDATAELGEALHDGIAERDPDFAGRWDPLACRLHLVDHEGRRHALRADSLDDGALRVGESLIIELEASGAVAVTPDASARGRVLRPFLGGVRSDCGFWGVLVADHRGSR